MTLENAQVLYSNIVARHGPAANPAKVFFVTTTTILASRGAHQGISSEWKVVASLVYRLPGDGARFVTAVQGSDQQNLQDALMGLLELVSDIMARRDSAPVTKPEGMKESRGGWIDDDLLN